MDDREELKALRRLAELEAKASAKPAHQGLVDDTGFFDAMMIAGGKAATRLGQGAQQLYYGAKEQVGDKDARRKLDELSRRVADEDRLYAPLAEARPYATGFGEALPSMVVPIGGAANLAGRAGRAALAGALPGLLEYGDAGQRAKRGLIGGIAGAAAPVVGAAAKTGHALLEPLFESGRKKIVGRTLNRAAGDNAAQVAQRMDAATELVPGSMPTAAEVAQSGGISALQRSASAADPEAYTQRAMSQSSARMGALRAIAKDDATMAAAETDRMLASAPKYAQADMGVAPLDAMFDGLLKRDQFKAAVSRAQELARDSGLDDIFFRDASGNPTALLGEGAHLVKKALDEAGEFGAKSYTGKHGASSANATNDLFQAWLEQRIPEYAQAKATYAAKSAPINQMQVGRSLMDAASPALADYGALGRETAAKYAHALRNGDQVAAKAIGRPSAKMADVMTPQQMKLLEAIAQDLGRKANAQDLGRGVGSDTFQKLAMQNIAEKSGAPRAANWLLGLPVISRGTAWAYRDADEKMQQAIAEALLNPKKAAELMRRAGIKNQTQGRQLLEQTALRAGLLAAPAVNQLVAE
jgi:hypothetical protein